MAVPKHELFRSPSGALYLVKRTTLGEFALYRLDARFVRRFNHKYAAVQTVERGNADDE